MTCPASLPFWRLLFITFLGNPLFAAPGDLVRTVRGKISAGDLFTGEAAVSEYKREHGVDAEYLGAVGWLARGAALLGKTDRAWAYVAEVRREIPEEKADLTIALGAAIETEGRLRAARDGRGAALRFLETEYARAKDTELRCRIRKNVNLLSLEGQPAPEMTATVPKGSPPSSSSGRTGAATARRRRRPSAASSRSTARRASRWSPRRASSARERRTSPRRRPRRRR